MARASRIRMVRRSRALVSSPKIWKPRLVFWAGALAIGVISAGFAALADQTQGLFLSVASAGGWQRFAPLAITPLGFVLCAWLADTYFPGSQGSGIPQCIAARHLRDDEERGGYLSLRTVFGKVALTIVGLGCGASIGREGPTVQVGASMMLQAGRLGGMMQARGLILAGSAAGIAAAFNTPLAGVVFAIEEMSRSYQARTNGIVLATVIIAGLASLALVGNYTYFGVTHAAAKFPGDWPLVIVCGVIGGALGAGFSHGTLRLTRRIRRWRSIQPKMRVIAVAAAAGAVVAVIGVATDGLTFGTGYSQAAMAIQPTPGEASLPPTFFLGKFIVSLASTVSGIPGGLFAPSLAVGAGLGSLLGTIFGSNASLAAVLGMTGYFAGVTQAPMTAFVIIVEMTGNHDNVVPLMAAAVIGYGMTRLIAPEPLYHALSRFFVADALRKRRAAAAAAKDAGETRPA